MSLSVKKQQRKHLGTVTNFSEVNLIEKLDARLAIVKAAKIGNKGISAQLQDTKDKLQRRRADKPQI